MEAPSCDPHHSLPSLLYPLPCSSMGKAFYGMVCVWVWVRYCVLSWWVPGLPLSPLPRAAFQDISSMVLCALLSPGTTWHIVCPGCLLKQHVEQQQHTILTSLLVSFSVALDTQKIKTNKQKRSLQTACGTTTTYNPG